MKAKDEYISNTGDTHNMDPKYGLFLSYPRDSIRDYATLGNGGKEPITGYGTTLVYLVGKVIYKCKVFHALGLHNNLYLLCQHHILLG